MNFIWTRKGSTWDIDGEIVTDHSEETGVQIAYVGDEVFRVKTATLYDISSYSSYKFRTELLITGSNVPDRVHLAELYHEQIGDFWYLRERYGTAEYDPSSSFGYSNEVWKGLKTVAYSDGPFTHIDITIELITRGENNGFYVIPIPGDFEISIRHYPNGTEAGADSVGTATIRGLFIENLELECPFDPLEGPGQVNFDVVAYPNDWFPTSAISWKVWEETGSAPLIPGAPGANGLVAQVSAEWDGKSEGEYLIGLVDLDTSIIADVSGPGNTYDFGNDDGVLHHRKCPCSPETGEVSFSIPITIGGSSLGTVNLTYQGFNACRAPNSFGYGWTSNGSALLTEDASGDLIYRDEGGRVKRWTEDNGVYTAVRTDNYAQVESLGNPGAPYRVTFKNRTTREFNANGKLTQETDRNGNTTTYTYTTGGDLETISDGRGGLLTYNYGSRLDGQPVSIRSGPVSSGRLVQFSYNGNRLESITNPAGEVIEFEYDADGRLSKQTEVRPNQGDRVIEHVYHAPTGRKRYSDFYGVWREQYDAPPWSYFAIPTESEVVVGPIPENDDPIDGRGVLYQWDNLGRIQTVENNRIITIS